MPVIAGAVPRWSAGRIHVTLKRFALSLASGATSYGARASRPRRLVRPLALVQPEAS